MDTLSKDNQVLEPSYYASRVIEVFRNLKERLSYQGGGSLSEHCQKEFLRHALSTVLDSVVEEYGKRSKGRWAVIQSQVRYDMEWLSEELRKEVEDKMNMIKKLTEFMRLMKLEDKEELLTELFEVRNWTYNTICFIIQCHPLLIEGNDKDIIKSLHVLSYMTNRSIY